MFRLSNLLTSVIEEKKARVLDGSIAIWNFTNRCNLSCMHCYSKADLTSVDTLSTQKIMDTLPKLKNSGVKFIIFSGGEPMTRKDLFDIALRCRELGIITYLSTNGLYVTKSNAQKIVDTFNYVGISIDGSEDTHDKFRGLKGSFKESMKSVKILNDCDGAKVGIRFTITKDTYDDLKFIFELAEKENIPKVYISHLVYSGRGLDNLEMDLSKEQRRDAVNFIIDKAFEYHNEKRDIEIVTGNMEQDGILFLERFAKEYPNLKDEMEKRLISWGGNSAGRKLLNIDSVGNVKPDPFFPKIIGNIFDDDFEDIWKNKPIELLKNLREHPRNISGKCEECDYIDICNGGSRSRAYAIYGDMWAEDPSCYLSNDEIKRG
ncbi:Heme d1 biosynthesis protein NirJ [hydrothermal vent metagenome]|uniref:Heme d1 biosynthesis protein NirJ n=1 Tax=hydrothermal vent metagenome TaxID=652676 RepID=A0A1W1EJK4_9ZZZZ